MPNVGLHRINLALYDNWFFVILFIVVAIVWLGLWLRIRKIWISLGTILVLNQSSISVWYLVESRLGAINFITFFLIVWHVVSCIASRHLHLLGVLFPFVRVRLPPLPLLLPRLNVVWVRLRRHLHDLAGGVPYLIAEIGVLPLGRLAGPLADGLVIVAVREVVVDLLVLGY